MEPSFGPDRTETDGNCHVWKLERGAPSKKIGNRYFFETTKTHSVPGLPDFSWCNVPKREKINQIDTSIPNGRK
jgi:hypothetical protein